MTYLPLAFVRRFLAACAGLGHIDDVAMSGWHYRNVAPEVPITWDIRPVHLHYPTGGLLP